MTDMKWKKVWFFGGDSKDTTIDDYITAYVCDTYRIEVQYSFTSFNHRWYQVGERCFDTLKEAKEYCK